MRSKMIALAATAVLLGGVALAQTNRGMPGGERYSGSAMLESGGKLYVVSGRTLARLDAKTLKVEAKIDLGGVGKSKEVAEAEERSRREFMEQNDADNDGEITQDELGRRRYIIFRYDTNGDRKLNAEELKGMAPPAPGASGEVNLVVKDGSIFMLRSGMVFAIDAGTLELKAAATVVEPPKPAPPPQPAAAPAQLQRAPARPDEKKPAPPKAENPDAF